MAKAKGAPEVPEVTEAGAAEVTEAGAAEVTEDGAAEVAEAGAAEVTVDQVTAPDRQAPDSPQRPERVVAVTLTGPMRWGGFDRKEGDVLNVPPHIARGWVEDRRAELASGPEAVKPAAPGAS